MLRPSFFAYTEGVSDARAECNYFAGGSLSKIKMNGIRAEEETLLTDEDGVYRDPNLHFDGQHLLFSWKKSAKDDDFHLYEMDLKTREVKQLTFGKDTLISKVSICRMRIYFSTLPVAEVRWIAGLPKSAICTSVTVKDVICVR